MAMMTASAVWGVSEGVSEYSHQNLKGREDRSTLEIVSEMISVPKRSDWARMAS